jgi:hypothetical protein
MQETIELTENEKAMISEIDQHIMADTLRREGALNMCLKSRGLSDGQWNYTSDGVLRRTDLPKDPPTEPEKNLAPFSPTSLQTTDVDRSLNPELYRILSARENNDPNLAIKIADEIINKNKSYTAFSLKAASLGDLGRRDEAIEVCNGGLQFCTEQSQKDILLHERGFQRILLGDYKNGFLDWEHRIQRENLRQNIEKAWPNLTEWKGEENRMVLVCGEKGLGDSILFARYLSVLWEKNCTIQFLASKASTPMAPILKEYPNVYGAYSGNDQIPAISENWIALESLPLYTNTIPPPFEFPVKWKPIPHENRKLRVGLCWHGNPDYSASANRRPQDLKFWEPITQVKDVEFVSLQLGEQGPCSTLLPADSTLLNTLQIACNCDLVISTDTSVVHMAATCGVPTWMPYHKLGYWPWESGEDGTVWYPTLKIFQQKDKSGWKPVFKRMADKLCDRSF